MNFSLTDGNLKTGYLSSKDKTSLFYRHYPVTNKKAFVFLLHGFGEHSGRYGHVVDCLRKEAYEVFCIDFRGHGHSKGERGHVDSFEHYADDAIAGIQHVQKNLLHGKKLFILAHSMGGLVALRAAAAMNANFSGIVLSSPLFQLKIPVPKWKRQTVFFLARYVPKLRLKTGIRGAHLSSDAKQQAAYDNDPLVLKNLSLRAFCEIYDGFQKSHTLAKKLSQDLLIQVAGADPVVDSELSTHWFKQVDQTLVSAKLRVYSGFLHEIYNERQRMEPINDFIT